MGHPTPSSLASNQIPARILSRDRRLISVVNGVHGAWFASHSRSYPGAPGYGWQERSLGNTTVRYGINYKIRDETNNRGLKWNHGQNKPIQSIHAGGAFVLFADGSVRFLSEGIQLNVLLNLADRRDGNILDDQDF